MNWSRRSSPCQTGIQLRLRVTDFIVSVAIWWLIASFFALSILAFSSVFVSRFYCQCNCWMNWSRHSSPYQIGIQFCLRVTDFAVGVVVRRLIASFFALSIFVLSSFLASEFYCLYSCLRSFLPLQLFLPILDCLVSCRLSILSNRIGRVAVFCAVFAVFSAFCAAELAYLLLSALYSRLFARFVQ